MKTQTAEHVPATATSPYHHIHLLASPYGWRLYEDRPGKMGWIIEYTTTTLSSSLAASSVSSSVSSSAAAATLTLQSTRPHPSAHEKNTKEGSLLLLTIVYLRSYENMGMATVTLCSQTVLTLGMPHARSEPNSLTIHPSLSSSLSLFPPYNILPSYPPPPLTPPLAPYHR